MVSFESIVRVVGTFPRNVGSDCLLLHYGIRRLQIDRLMLVSYDIRLSTWIKRNANRLIIIPLDIIASFPLLTRARRLKDIAPELPVGLDDIFSKIRVRSKFGEMLADVLETSVEQK